MFQPTLTAAKEVGKTQRGNLYIILQDAPTSFHVSVVVEGITYYDHVEQPQSKEEIMKRIEELEVRD
jgi:hypothetical protein